MRAFPATVLANFPSRSLATHEKVVKTTGLCSGADCFGDGSMHVRLLQGRDYVRGLAVTNRFPFDLKMYTSLRRKSNLLTLASYSATMGGVKPYLHPPSSLIQYYLDVGIALLKPLDSRAEDC